MSERENIIGRIREALKVEAARPGHAHGEGLPHVQELPNTATMRRSLPPGRDELDEKLRLFKKNAADLRAEFLLLKDTDEMLSTVLGLRDSENWTRIGTHRGELTDSVSDRLKLPVCRTDGPYEASDLENCSVGITQCDALVAQTGSVLVSSHSAGGRALSVLPPHHLILARRTQMLRDLPEAFDLLKKRYAPNYPSFISFITGPSRTGDIERILVLGAHGPKKLTILCI